MKSIALTGIAKMGTIQEADPVIQNETDVIVKITHVGVCGSDMHLYEEGHIGDNWVDYPFVVGHEGVGIVDQVGGDVKHVKPGDRIAISRPNPAVNVTSAWRAGHIPAGTWNSLEVRASWQDCSLKK